MTTSGSTPNTAPRSRLHVAVGVLSRNGEILVAERPLGAHQGGKWEFPGGKVLAGEAVREALVRELREELGIEVKAAYPLIQVHHAYGEREVFLDVWRVTEFSGNARGCEQQRIRWVSRNDLRQIDFLEANWPIVRAALLPSLYLVTDARQAGEADFLPTLERALRAGVRLLQLRAPQLLPEQYQRLARTVAPICHRYGAKLLLNGEPSWVDACGADGVHLNSRRLRALRKRPLAGNHWVGASTHDQEELTLAARLEVDFAVLSPVLYTQSHSHLMPLGWERFRQLCAGANLPIYAFGGMRAEHLQRARASGACGLAMVSGVWNAPSMEQVVAAVR